MNDIEELSCKVNEIAIEAGKIASIIMVTEHMIRDANVKVNARCIAEDACYQFILTMGVPIAAAVNRQHEIIAEYPASLWDHIKHKLGWKCVMTRVTCTEVVSFPSLIDTLGPRLREAARISLSIRSYEKDAEES